MTDAHAILLLPGFLTVILYALAVLLVVASRRAAGGPRGSAGPGARRNRPRLRVISGGRDGELPRAARRAP